MYMLLVMSPALLQAHGARHADAQRRLAQERLVYRPEDNRVMRSLKFNCPASCVVGSKFALTDPEGRRHTITIPNGAKPNHRVEVFVNSSLSASEAATLAQSQLEVRENERKYLEQLDECGRRKYYWNAAVNRGIESTGWIKEQRRGMCIAQQLKRHEELPSCVDASKIHRTCPWSPVRNVQLANDTRIFISGDSNVQGLGVALMWHLSEIIVPKSRFRVKIVPDVCVVNARRGALAWHYSRAIDGTHWPVQTTLPSGHLSPVECGTRKRERDVWLLNYGRWYHVDSVGSDGMGERHVRLPLNCTGARRTTYIPSMATTSTPGRSLQQGKAISCKDCERCSLRRQMNDMGPCAYQRDLRALFEFIKGARHCLPRQIVWLETPDKPPGAATGTKPWQERVAQALLRTHLPDVPTITWPRACDDAYAMPADDSDRHLCFHTHSMQRLVQHIAEVISVKR